MGAVQYNQPASIWLANHPLRMVLYQGFRVSLCWSQIGPFSSCHSQVGLDEGKSMLLCLYVTSTPASMATFAYEPTKQWHRWQGKEADWYPENERVILSTWLLKSSSAEITLWSVFTWNSNISTFFPHSKKSIQISLSPKFPCHQHSNHVSPKILTSSQTTGQRPWISAHLHVWSFILSSKVNNQVQCLKFCPQGGFPSTTILQGCPRNELHYCSQPLFWAACVLCKTIYTPGFSLLFCGLILANFSQGHRCTLEKEDTVAE